MALPWPTPRSPLSSFVAGRRFGLRVFGPFEKKNAPARGKRRCSAMIARKAGPIVPERSAGRTESERRGPAPRGRAMPTTSSTARDLIVRLAEAN